MMMLVVAFAELVDVAESEMSLLNAIGVAVNASLAIVRAGLGGLESVWRLVVSTRHVWRTEKG